MGTSYFATLTSAFSTLSNVKMLIKQETGTAVFDVSNIVNNQSTFTITCSKSNIVQTLANLVTNTKCSVSFNVTSPLKLFIGDNNISVTSDTTTTNIALNNQIQVSQVTVANLPTLNQHVTSKSYVDKLIRSMYITDPYVTTFVTSNTSTLNNAIFGTTSGGYMAVNFQDSTTVYMVGISSAIINQLTAATSLISIRKATILIESVDNPSIFGIATITAITPVPSSEIDLTVTSCAMSGVLLDGMQCNVYIKKL
jgi:hypothetical protein